MPAMACCVDAVAAGAAAPVSGVAPPSFTFFGATADASSHASGIFPCLPSATNTTAVAANSTVWSPQCSAELYRIDGWGRPYFSVNSSGNVTVHPYGNETLPHQEIDLMKVVKKVSNLRSTGGLGLQLPLVVRFPDVLKHRLESLQSAFDLAIHTQGYGAHYQGVYPVKCNQDRFVVEDIVKFGCPFRFGLEAGSKPELLLAMSCLCKGHPDALLVCNGFKDSEYISLALIARKLHLNTVIVLEQEEELGMVIELSRKLNVRPVIGVRAKLRTRHSGHFGSTSGEKGKFGLNITQILHVARRLKSLEMLDCLQLLHFHIGSQIPSTDLLADGVSEGAQIYSELVRLGASMGVIDIGGGLGIDYDGSKSIHSDISVGYTLQEYASAVVRAVGSVCDQKGVMHPVICSESGRAIVSHHSILVFEAFSSSPATLSSGSASWASPEDSMEELSEEIQAEYHSLWSAAMNGDYETCVLYADQLKHHCVDLFKDGSLRIEQLAAVDALYDLVSKALGVADRVRTYHVNLSIFTSIPDFWGIDQMFPIMPIHRLDERPGVRGILSDLTCDSDGKIDKFIGGESSLPLHEIAGSHGGCGGGDNSKYYLGMFLGGAYEEALGGLHNLFGGPSVVRVMQSDGPHSFAVTRAMPGPSCGDVLRAMQHEPQILFQSLKHRAEECILAAAAHHHDHVVDDSSDSDDRGGDGNNNMLCHDVSADALVDRIAHSFHNMPYLVMDGIEELENGGNGCFNPTGGYCSSDANFSGSASEGTVGEEDELWADMCA